MFTLQILLKEDQAPRSCTYVCNRCSKSKFVELASRLGVCRRENCKGPREAIINAERTTIVEDDDEEEHIHFVDFRWYEEMNPYIADATGHTHAGVANEETMLILILKRSDCAYS